MRSPTEVPTAQLTARQREILAFVNEHSAQHGYPPTVREIGTAVGLTSSSTVHAHLANLERLGLLRRDPAKPRALNLVGREQKVPATSETAGITTTDGRELPPQKKLNVRVLTRENGRWLVAAFHNTPLR